MLRGWRRGGEGARSCKEKGVGAFEVSSEADWRDVTRQSMKMPSVFYKVLNKAMILTDYIYEVE